jgi:hypothetical protein
MAIEYTKKWINDFFISYCQVIWVLVRETTPAISQARQKHEQESSSRFSHVN